MRSNEKATVLFLLAVMVFAILVVDDRWIRAGLGVLPALLLAQRVLWGSGLGAPPKGGPEEERRADNSIRDRIQELLKLIREFYSTCHMVAIGQLEASKAKSKAAEVEKQLNQMMAEMLEKIEGMEEAAE